MSDADKKSPIDVYVGAKLRNLRKLRGFNQQGLAKLLDLTFQQIQKYETGTNRVPVSRLFEMAAKLNVTIDYFYEGFENPLAMSKVTNDTETELSVNEFLATYEGRELALQFSRISHPKVRRKVVELAKSLLDAQVPPFTPLN